MPPRGDETVQSSQNRGLISRFWHGAAFVLPFMLRKGSLSPTCLLGVCDLPSLGDRDSRRRSGDSSCAWGLLSSELQREMSGDSRCLRSLDRPRSLPERCPSDRWPAGCPRQSHHPLCSSRERSAGGVLGILGLTRVSVEAPGGQLERGVVAAPAGLIGVVAAALHGELIQPGAVGPLVPDGGERSPHGAGVCHHLQATPASRGQR